MTVKIKVNNSWVTATGLSIRAPTSSNLNSTLAGYTNQQLASRTVGDMTAEIYTSTAIWVKVNGTWTQA